MNSSVLVTGGAGYLGSVLTEELLNAGYKVTVIDNFMFQQTSLAGLCHRKDLEIVRGDARDTTLLKRHLTTVDIIIPLAALVGAPLCDADPAAAESTNREAIRSIVNLASKQQRIVIPNTNSGYGIGEQGKYCTEESPLRPVSLYGRTKVEAEEIVLDRGEAISLRLATVFGMSPRMRIDLLVNDFTHRAVFDRFVVVFEGHFKRNYIHIRDVAAAFLHALAHFESMRNLPYNVGLSTANLSKLELCERIKEHIPSFVVMEAPVGEDPDKRDYIVSNERIESHGYRPAHSLDDGIKELVKGYRMLKKSPLGNV